MGVQMDRAAIAKVGNNLRGVLDYELKARAEALSVEVDRLLGGEPRGARPIKRQRRVSLALAVGSKFECLCTVDAAGNAPGYTS